MKTLLLRVVPKEGSPASTVAWHSYPNVAGDARITLEGLQAAADMNNVAVTYELASDLEYFACRGARKWLMSEPGDSDEDHAFKVALIRAGVIANISESCVISCDEVDDEIVLVNTTRGTTLINTATGTVTQHQAALPDLTLRGPVTGMQ